MHERSETIQDPETGKWINVYGKGTPQAGARLPGSGEYATVEEAVGAATLRSQMGGKPPPIPQMPQTPTPVAPSLPTQGAPLLPARQAAPMLRQKAAEEPALGLPGLFSRMINGQ